VSATRACRPEAPPPFGANTVATTSSRPSRGATATPTASPPSSVPSTTAPAGWSPSAAGLKLGGDEPGPITVNTIAIAAPNAISASKTITHGRLTRATVIAEPGLWTGTRPSDPTILRYGKSACSILSVSARQGNAGLSSTGQHPPQDQTNQVAAATTRRTM